MTNRPIAVATTRGIRVEASATLLPAAAASPVWSQSAPASVAIYRYRIRITNLGTTAARLLDRHWIILDGDGNRRDVRGEGVVGQHPHLEAGETFVYQSECPLTTVWGTMEGTYTFEDDHGERFVVAIPRFFLTPPTQPATAEA